MNYIDTLIDNCNITKVANPTKEFLLEKLADLNGMKHAIYIIEEIGGDIENTFRQFSEFKNKNERKCAKLNNPSQIMYVGSSTTGVRKRIEQHLGDGHKSTYALHLKYWFSGNYQITIKQYEVSNEVLQIIEDDLSDKLKPAFGKKGGNNK
jgi:Uri superfamily endonuclease